MTKLFALAPALNAMHPKQAPAASSNQTPTTDFGEGKMPKLANITLAVILFAPLAFVMLMQAAHIVA